MSATALPTQTQLCVVGGGPAGVIASYLFALHGIDVVLLEGEKDFDREFRGDTLHASSLEILDQLGHAQAILAKTTSRISMLELEFDHQKIRVADFAGVDTPFPYVAIIPQHDFLDYMVEQANALPNFSVIMNARVHELIRQDEKICGVEYKYENNLHTLSAELCIGADGRGSTLRRLADVKLDKTSPPMDVLWFKCPVPEILKGKGSVNAKMGNGHMLVSIDRRDYLQLGYVIMKGSYKELRQGGIENFHAQVIQLMPVLKESIHTLTDWSQVSILSVVTGRVKQWYQDGLLLIGDAAHVMSPVGGVGINYAIQDAVAAANILIPAIRKNKLSTDDLKRVQERRERAVKFIQGVQSFVQKNIIRSALKSDQPFKPPLPLKVVSRIPLMQKHFAKLLAYGLQPEKVQINSE